MRLLLLSVTLSVVAAGCADEGPVNALCTGPACAGGDVAFGADGSGDVRGPDVGAPDTGTPPDAVADTASQPDGSSMPDGLATPDADAVGVPDGSPPEDVVTIPDTSEPDAVVVPDAPTPDASTGECATDADCAAIYGSGGLDVCEEWSCNAQQLCEVLEAPDATPCFSGDEDGLCDAGSCVFACGDGFLQESIGEECDDDNLTSGDGCRSDCIIEEPIGEGWTGGQCEIDADCAPTGSICIPGAGGGSCALPCTSTCADQAGAPVTFCIDADEYDDAMDVTLPGELYPALCVSKCDFELFPRTGCRNGFHCELHNRHNQSVQDEVCVPGDWHAGLQLSADGSEVVGLDSGAEPPAQPYLKLLDLTCGGSFAPVDAQLFRAMADTLMAMGPDGRSENWDRLCSVPSNLPDTAHGLHAQVAAEQGFRLVGSRVDIVNWTAAGVYGSKALRGDLVGGPLWPVRSMVYGGSSYYLYADAAADYPYPWYPDRGRDFGTVNGDEWEPMDARLVPEEEYVTAKANKGDRFHRGWGRADVVAYVADMAIDHLLIHGEPLGIGDLSFPPGGDIDDHASHELGRDVDLYLLTTEPVFNGNALGARPWLWVSTCNSGPCYYYENDTGDDEDLSDAAHVPAADLLTTLAQYAYDNDGPTHFVQHDTDVLVPFVDLPGSSPVYVHGDNDGALGWPPHQNHIHMRFPL